MMVDDEHSVSGCGSGSSSEKLHSSGEQEEVADGAQVATEAAPKGTSSGRVKKRVRGKAVATSKRIRDLRRQLERFGAQMPPGAKRAKEEELEGLVALAAERARRDAETRTAKKYRMVKFFDRRKVERRLRSADAAVRAQAARDLRYVDEYPREEKYIALYPKGGHTDASLTQLEAMRARIEGSDGGAGVGGGADEEPAAAKADEDDFFLPG